LRTAFISFILLLFLTGCSEEQVVNPPADPEIKNIRFLPVLINDSLYTDPAVIVSANIENDILKLIVNYTGGCKEHYLELYSEMAFLESIPVQLNMKLSHNANDDICDRLVRDTLYFDLKTVKGLFFNYYGSSVGMVILNIKDPSDSTFLPKPFYRF
jgi:hypothetical protein